MNTYAMANHRSVNVAKLGRLLLGFNRLIDFRLLNICLILPNGISRVISASVKQSNLSTHTTSLHLDERLLRMTERNMQIR